MPWSGWQRSPNQHVPSCRLLKCREALPLERRRHRRRKGFPLQLSAIPTFLSRNRSRRAATRTLRQVFPGADGKIPFQEAETVPADASCNSALLEILGEQNAIIEKSQPLSIRDIRCSAVQGRRFVRSRTLRPPAEPWAVHIRIRYGPQTYKPMALTREYPPFEDPGGRKGLALRKGGFLYESTLDVFAYRAAGKIALRTSVEGRSLPEFKRFIDEAPPRPGRYQIFAAKNAPISLDTRRSLLVGLGWTN